MAVFRVQPAYRQFYLLDEGECPLYPEDIDDEDLRRGAKAVPFLIAVYARSDEEAEVRITADGTALPAEEWEHIVEAPLEIPSGTVLLATPETYLPHAHRVALAPGSYRVSIASRAANAGAPEQFAIWMSLASTAPILVVKDGRLHAA